jgi:hypothetical protein
MRSYPRSQTAVLVASIALMFCHQGVFPATAQDAQLEKSIADLLKKYNYSPSLFPTKPFAVTDVDPLLIHASWETVRLPLEKLTQAALSLAEPPNLRLHLVMVSPNDNSPQKFRIVFGAIFDKRLRDSLIAALKLPDKSFLSFGEKLVLLTNPSDAIELKRVTTKSLDLNKLRVALQEFLATEPTLKKFGLKLTALDPASPKDRFETRTTWILLKALETPRPTEFFWRIAVAFEKLKSTDFDPGPEERWKLRTVVEIGRKAAGQKQTEVLQDTDMVNQFAFWLNATIDKPLSLKDGKSVFVRSDRPSTNKTRYTYVENTSGKAFLGPDEGTLAEPVFESPLTLFATAAFNGTKDLILQQTAWTLVQATTPQ